MGVANIQNCVTNGTMYFTSRNLTLSALSHSPTPSEVTSASSSSAGSQRMFHVGTMP